MHKFDFLPRRNLGDSLLVLLRPTCVGGGEEKKNLGANFGHFPYLRRRLHSAARQTEDGGDKVLYFGAGGRSDVAGRKRGGVEERIWACTL